IARLRPSLRRAARSRLAASSARAASSAAGGFSVSGRRASPSSNSLRIYKKLQAALVPAHAGIQLLGPRLRGDERRMPATLASGSFFKIMPRIRAVERLVAEREVSDDVAVNGGFQQRPLKPRRIAHVAARDCSAL